MRALSRNKLTVIAITYNHARFFEKSIKSILSQRTSFGFSVHVLDDASTDGTSDIVRHYANKYPGQVVPFIRKTNLGAVKNVYTGLRDVETQYYATIETDDWWCDDGKLQLQVDALDENPDCSFSGHNTSKNYADEPHHAKQNQNLFSCPSHKISFPQKFLPKKHFKVHVSSRVYRTRSMALETLGNLEIPVWDSTSFWWGLSKGDCYYIDRVMSVYNMNRESLYAYAHREAQNRMAVRNILAINKELGYKHNRVFIDALRPYVDDLRPLFGIPRLQYLKLKFFSAPDSLERSYRDLVANMFAD